MAISSRSDFASAVLSKMGAPVTSNNIQTFVNWMIEENGGSNWAPRNNPLNNGLGSGGGEGLGSYKSLEDAAMYAAQNLSAGNYGYPAAKAVLMADGTDSSFRQAIINSSWAGGHYAGTGYAQGRTMGSDSSGAVTGTGTGGTNTNPQSAVQVGGENFSGTQSQVDAIKQMNSVVGSYGFSGNELKQLVDWSWNEIIGNIDPTQVVLDLQNHPVFEARFPGLKERTAAGFDAISVSDYINYETAALQQARALGLPEGFMSKQEIGSLIAGNVSADELSNRLNNVYVVANNSTPEVKAQLKAYFGADITPGGLAALALDPKKAEPILQQQLTAAQLGGAGVSAGLGAVSKGTAIEIAQTGITQSGIQSGIGQIAPLAALETALPGQTTNATANTVSVDQLAKGQFLSSAADQRALQVAQESRLAPFKGGGGSVATQKGVVGLGSASSSGAPSQ